MSTMQDLVSHDVVWTLDLALELIRNLQPAAMQKGYYLALAGGVLNNGYSVNDLDLVAVPRTKTSVEVEFVECLNTFLVPTREPGYRQSTMILHYSYNGKPIDIAVVNL